MARRQQELACPRGVTVRAFKTERRIQVAFSYRGKECRELLPPQNITQTALNLAGGLRQEIQRKIKDGTFTYADYFPHSDRAKQFGMAGSRTTVGELLERQLEAYRHQVKHGTLSPSTLEGYEKAITGKRLAKWRPSAVAEVTPSALRDWIGAFGLTAKTARNILTPLRSVFEDALNDGLIAANPFEKIALGKLLRQTATASDYDADPFTANEREQLLAAARAEEVTLLRFWLNAGLRPGEILALRWDRVDWAARTVRIDLNRVAGVEKGPKTEAGIRDVRLNDEAIAALQAQKAYTFLARAYVFHNPRTGEPWSTDAQVRKTMWEPLVKRAKIRHRNVYQVRHTYASALLTAGENPWFVAQQLGHVDVTMVFQTYGKFISEDYQKPKTPPRLKLVSSEE